MHHHLYPLETEAPIAQLNRPENRDEVWLGYWSHWRIWEDGDYMGDVVLPIGEARAFMVTDGTCQAWT